MTKEEIEEAIVIAEALEDTDVIDDAHKLGGALLAVYDDNQQLARDIHNLKMDKEHLLMRITALEKKLNKRP